MSNEEEDEEDEFFQDTFSEKSFDVEDDEVDNNKLDNVLNEELKLILEKKKNWKSSVRDDDDIDMEEFDKMLAEQLKVPSSVMIAKEVTAATTKKKMTMQEKKMRTPALFTWLLTDLLCFHRKTKSHWSNLMKCSTT